MNDKEIIKDNFKKIESGEWLVCKIDGNALSITKSDFIDLQMSPAMFITLTDSQIKEFMELSNK